MRDGVNNPDGSHALSMLQLGGPSSMGVTFTSPDFRSALRDLLAPQPPLAPNRPDAPGAPGAPGGPGAPGAPGAPGGPDEPGTPGAPDALDPPDAPTEPVGPIGDVLQIDGDWDLSDLDVRGAERIDFGGQAHQVLLTVAQYQDIDQAEQAQGSTVWLDGYDQQAEAVEAWASDEAYNLVLEDVAVDEAFALTGITEALGEIFVNDPELGRLRLESGDAPGQTEGITAGEGLEKLVLAGDQPLAIKEYVNNGGLQALVGDGFHLRGEGEGSHRIETDANTRTIDARDVEESVTLQAGPGGLDLDKISGGIFGVLWHSGLDRLTLDAQAGDLTLNGSGTAIEQQLSTTSIDAVEILTGEGDVRLDGGDVELGAPDNGRLEVLGDGRTTVQELNFSPGLEETSYTFEVGEPSTLNLPNASSMDRDDDSTLAFVGDGTVELGADGALDCVGTLDLFTDPDDEGDLQAHLARDEEMVVKMGSAGHTFTLSGDGDGVRFEFDFDAFDVAGEPVTIEAFGDGDRIELWVGEVFGTPDDPIEPDHTDPKNLTGNAAFWGKDALTEAHFGDAEAPFNQGLGAPGYVVLEDGEDTKIYQVAQANEVTQGDIDLIGLLPEISKDEVILEPIFH